MILQVPSGKLTYRHGKDLIFPGVCLYDVEMLDFPASHVTVVCWSVSVVEKSSIRTAQNF